MSHTPTSPKATSPRGILRNAPELKKSEHLISGEEKLDRKQVLANTKLNAQLSSDSTDGLSEGDKIRQKLASINKKDDNHLQWDEVNLYLTEQDKSALMKIDEPKTPYEGGVDPNNDYYRTDNEDDEEEATLDDFALGEPLESTSETLKDSLNGGEIVEDDNDDSEEDEEEEEEEQISAEERHRRFEEKRKSHYHMKLELLKHPVPVDDEES